MKITVETIGIEFTEPLQAYLDKKMEGLEKVVKHFEGDGEVEVRVELSRTTKHHNKGEVYRVVSDLRLPKKVLRADVKSDDIRKGIDQVRDMLRLDIEKYKEKSLPAKKR